MQISILQGAEDGIVIPQVTDSATWTNLTTPGYCWYLNENENKNLYGALYNWFTIESDKICPAGWHVPSDEEWSVLIGFLANNGYNYCYVSHKHNNPTPANTAGQPN